MNPAPVRQWWRVCRLGLLAMFAGLLLSACSTTLQSEVRIKHEWPPQLLDKTYRFAPVTAREQGDDKAYEHYLNLLRPRLTALGFAEVPDEKQDAHLTVALQLAQYAQSVYQLDDVWYGAHGRYWSRFGHTPVLGPWHAVYWGPYFGPHYGPYLGPWRVAGSWYAPAFAYDPWFGRGPVYIYRESPYPNVQRRMRIVIEQNSDHKRLFEVQVENETRDDHADRVLGFMLDAALEGFPGQNGAVRKVEKTFE